MKESFKIVVTDGTLLQATRFIPEQPNGKVVLINSATGVKQGYYHAFATSLAEEGFQVYTYDYRGIGESKNGNLKRSKASMKDWGLWDYKSMLQNVFQTHPHSRVVVLGHSVGGQLIGFSPLSARADAFIMIGSQTPFWKNYKGFWMSLKLWSLWYFLIPVFTKLVGYFPGLKLGLFEDLPAGVARQWARWAKNRNYVFDEAPELKRQFSSLQHPSLMISFDDDEMAPVPAVKDLMQRYQRLKWNHWHINPDEVLQKKIGHFGFFKKKMKHTLWKETAAWMNKMLPPVKQATAA